MRIASFKIKNYKSFLETDEIKLTPGFNVIVGPNNVGKTALIEALSLRFPDNRHRSPKTAGRRNDYSEEPSKVEIVFELSKNEFLGLLGKKFYVPMSSNNTVSDYGRFLGQFSNHGNGFRCTYGPDQSSPFGYLAGYGHMATDQTFQVLVSDNFDTSSDGQNYIIRYHDQYGYALAAVLPTMVYRFDAERLNVSRSEAGPQPNLERNARNLPQVINYLQTRDPSGYEQLNNLFRAVFPGVWKITVPPLDLNTKDVGIFVWEISPATRRDDLARPLSDCGTGLGQVLAMLYVVLTSHDPRIIIIDEPQSFLHPGAIRTLFEILRRDFSQHQYIVTTHSPIVISAANPETVLLLRKPEMETQIRTIDKAQTTDLELCLREVGARLSDVFGADNVLWVEGATEEKCFPRILTEEKCFSHPLPKDEEFSFANTKILGVVQTGDFEGRLADRILPIYERLSKGSGLIPPTVGVIIDQELRTKEAQLSLSQKHRGLHFLPRRMYENYLLNPRAIAAVTSQIDGFREPVITEAEVTDWLEEHKWDVKYFAPDALGQERSEELWRERVHGANLLHDLFVEFSEARVQFKYDKVRYCIAFTEWILEHEPQAFTEIVDLLKSILTEGEGKEHSLDNLLSGVTDENRQDEVDFGPPVEKEAW